MLAAAQLEAVGPPAPPQPEPAREQLAPRAVPPEQQQAATAAYEQFCALVDDYRETLKQGGDVKKTAAALELLESNYESFYELYAGTDFGGLAILTRIDAHRYAGEHKQAMKLYESAIKEYKGTAWEGTLRGNAALYWMIHRHKEKGAYVNAHALLSVVQAPPVPRPEKGMDYWLISRNWYEKAQVLMSVCEARMGKENTAKERIEAVSDYIGGVEELKKYHTQAYRRYVKAMELLQDKK